MKKYGHWDISEVGEFDVSEYIGFVYLVEFHDGFKYIGSKKIWNSVCESNSINSNSKQSNWKTYRTSQSRARSRIKNHPSRCVLKIVSLHKTYNDVLQAEKCMHIENDVVNNPVFFNMSVATCNLEVNASSVTTKLWQDPAYRFKVNRAKALTQVKKNPSLYQKYYAYVPRKSEFDAKVKARADRYARIAKKNSEIQKGRSLTDEHKQALSAAAKTRKHRKDNYRSTSESLKEYYKNNPRASEHVKNNMASRKPAKYIKELVINGMSFNSVRAAAKYLGISEHRVKKLILNEMVDSVVYK